MRGPFVQQRRNDEEESEEARFVVVKEIRDAILEPLSLESGCQRSNWGKCSMSAGHLSGKSYYNSFLPSHYGQNVR